MIPCREIVGWENTRGDLLAIEGVSIEICIFTCPADVAQPIPEDISKENDDQIQAVLDATATSV